MSLDVVYVTIVVIYLKCLLNVFVCVTIIQKWFIILNKQYF